MGKKTERIAELEERLAAANSLIRTVGTHLAVDVGDDITPDNVRRYSQRFQNAIYDLPGRSRPAFENSAERVEDKRPAPPRASWDTFDDEVDEEIDRLGDKGLVPARQPEAMLPAEHSGLASIMDIARELGLDIAGIEANAALSLIYQELLRIKNPGDVGEGLTKGDTLAEAIGHGRKVEHDLRNSIRDARDMITRIAGAMQLPDWDPKDPEAVLARIQRWESIKHLVRRRILHFEKSHPLAGAVLDERAILDELRAILTQIIAPADLGKFMGKLPPPVASRSALEAAGSPPVSVADLLNIQDVVRASMLGPSRVTSTLTRMCEYKPLVEDFLSFMNLVVMPVLARHKAPE